MSKLYLYNYNNYFNRIVKKEDTLANYGTPIYTLSDTNFNPNDGVTTSHVCNYTKEDGDYVIITDDTNKIVSRWFVVETQRTRGHQYKLDLKRDLIVDYYDRLLNAPMIINRGMAKNRLDPLLFNSEGFSFNQIKKNEILLKDKTKIPYYILYFKKGTNTLSGTFNKNDVTYDMKISTPIANSIFKTGTSYKTMGEEIDILYRVHANAGAAFYFSNKYRMSLMEYFTAPIFNYESRSMETNLIWFDNDDSTCQAALTTAFSNSWSSLIGKLNSDLGHGSTLSDNDYNTILNMNNKYIKDSDNKIYQINVTISTTPLEGTLTSGLCYDDIVSRIDGTGLTRYGSIADAIKYYETFKTVNVIATEITTGAVNWSINWSGKRETSDSDFNIVAIPYDNITANYNNTDYAIDNSSCKLLVDSIIQVAGDNLVDIQLFPYCPLQIMTNNNGKLVVDQGDSSEYDLDTTNKLVILYVQNSNFTFDILLTINVPIVTGYTLLDYKISNECDLYKIVSPNYNGSFEFSVAKNDGVNYFNVDSTLIPYKPYIHINPNFKGLYGQDWNDSKGLLCGGDFSLPKYSDAWANYQLQNKNYQQIFDRQVRNLDFVQSQEMFKAQFSAVAGSLTGGIGGALVGAKTGGPVGAAVGGTIGTVASAAGGIVDVNLLKAAQAENKSLMLDNYNYNLGNIKALPDTINKVTPITFNNKKFPFIEYYSSTDEEKQLLINSITYKSMRINAIDILRSYIKTDRSFISGSIIRLEDLELNAHEANEIYNEFMKGVYI